MKYLLVSLMLSTGCGYTKEQQPQAKIVRNISAIVKPAVGCDYETIKATAQQLFKQQALHREAVSASRFTRYVSDYLFSCWYGTPWVFNGTTTVPGIGKIACGYFVTTMLKDAGLKLNRVVLAERASEEIIRKLALQ